ncbi:alpha/beta fold hydrolase [Kitasatospora sp. NBC_00315]|uniref:alpha/beta fold hydrolase n=1 Tax=Kitasatospora sp. NBC_00315 TaxID=2975963 RepID=UPI00325393F3
MSSTDALATRYLDVPGGRLGYDDTGHGTGTTVLLLPGMLVSRSIYRDLRPLLAAAGHRVVTMDLRGFGDASIAWDDYSPAAIATDALALLDHLGIGRAVLVGHSYTGATVVRAAGLAPERVAGIALLSAFIEGPPANAFQKALMKTVGALWLRFPSTWGTYQRFAFPTKPAGFEEHRTGVVAALRTPGRKQATRGHLGGNAAPVGWSTAVTCPALAVMGSGDPDFPKPELVADHQAAALNGRKVMIEGAGHYLMLERPQTTADALLAFLGESA